MDLPKHHYIPVFYLKQWATPDGRLHEFSRPTGKQVEARPTSAKGTGYQRGLYRLNGLPEDLAEQVERKFMQQVDNLAYDALQVNLGKSRVGWTITTRSSWSRLITGMLFRNPERINSTKRALEDHWLEKYEERLAEYNSLKGPKDPDFLDFIIASSERGAMRLAQNVIDNKNVGPNLNGMRWFTIDTTKVGRPFFTSDRPIIMTNGIGNLESHLAIPISPTRIFMACNTADEEKRLRSIVPRELVKGVNKTVIRQAIRYAWNTGKGELEFVRRHLSEDARFDRDFFANTQSEDRANAVIPPSDRMTAGAKRVGHGHL
jgi:hypothetical protein